MRRPGCRRDHTGTGRRSGVVLVRQSHVRAADLQAQPRRYSQKAVPQDDYYDDDGPPVVYGGPAYVAGPPVYYGYYPYPRVYYGWGWGPRRYGYWRRW